MRNVRFRLPSKSFLEHERAQFIEIAIHKTRGYPSGSPRPHVLFSIYKTRIFRQVNRKTRCPFQRIKPTEKLSRNPVIENNAFFCHCAPFPQYANVIRPARLKTATELKEPAPPKRPCPRQPAVFVAVTSEFVATTDGPSARITVREHSHNAVPVYCPDHAILHCQPYSPTPLLTPCSSHANLSNNPAPPRIRPQAFAPFLCRIPAPIPESASRPPLKQAVLDSRGTHHERRLFTRERPPPRETRPEASIPNRAHMGYAVSDAFPAARAGAGRRIRGLGRAEKTHSRLSWGNAVAPIEPHPQTHPEAEIPRRRPRAIPENASGNGNPMQRSHEIRGFERVSRSRRGQRAPDSRFRTSSRSQQAPELERCNRPGRATPRNASGSGDSMHANACNPTKRVRKRESRAPRAKPTLPDATLASLVTPARKKQADLLSKDIPGKPSAPRTFLASPPLGGISDNSSAYLSAPDAGSAHPRPGPNTPDSGTVTEVQPESICDFRLVCRTSRPKRTGQQSARRVWLVHTLRSENLTWISRTGLLLQPASFIPLADNS